MSRAIAARTRPAPQSQEASAARFRPEKILALSGKHLDTAIAECVMGWTTRWNTWRD